MVGYKLSFLLIYLLIISCIFYINESISVNHLLIQYKSDCQQFSENSQIIFRNDDINAFSNLEHEKRIFSIFQKYQIPQVIGVIPYASENCITCINQKYHDIRSTPDIIDYFARLRDMGLVEIGQHGYQHCSNYLHDMALNGLSEFNDLSYAEQFDKISRGKTILESAFGQEVTTFIPPYNRFDNNTLEVLENLNFTILSDGSGINNSTKVHTINRNASLTELHEYLNQRETNLPPYLFIMYHSYELKDDVDSIFLDSLLSAAQNNPKIRFSTLSDFNKNYYSQIQTIETLNSRFEQLLNKKWFCFYFINHLINNISDKSFKELNRGLRLHDIRILTKDYQDLCSASMTNFIIQNFLIILFLTGIFFLTTYIRHPLHTKTLILFLLFVLILKIWERLLIFLKYGLVHFYLCDLFFLTTCGLCFFIYCQKHRTNK